MGETTLDKQINKGKLNRNRRQTMSTKPYQLWLNKCGITFKGKFGLSPKKPTNRQQTYIQNDKRLKKEDNQIIFHPEKPLISREHL